MSQWVALSLKINGRSVGPIEVPSSANMIEVLHEYLNLTGTRFGCGVAQCRACTVIVDQPDGSSEPMVTCIVPAIAFQGLYTHDRRSCPDKCGWKCDTFTRSAGLCRSFRFSVRLLYAGLC